MPILVAASLRAACQSDCPIGCLQAGKTSSPDSVTSAQALAPAQGKSPGTAPRLTVEVAAHSFSPQTPAASPLSSQSAAAEPRRGTRRCDTPDSASLPEHPFAQVTCCRGQAAQAGVLSCSVCCLHSPLQGPVGSTICVCDPQAACSASLWRSYAYACRGEAVQAHAVLCRHLLSARGRQLLRWTAQAPGSCVPPAATTASLQRGGSNNMQWGWQHRPHALCPVSCLRSTKGSVV